MLLQFQPTGANTLVSCPRCLAQTNFPVQVNQGTCQRCQTSIQFFPTGGTCEVACPRCAFANRFLGPGQLPTPTTMTTTTIVQPVGMLGLGLYDPFYLGGPRVVTRTTYNNF